MTVRAHVRQRDSSLPSDWHDDAPQKVRALVQDLHYNVLLLILLLRLTVATPVSLPRPRSSSLIYHLIFSRFFSMAFMSARSRALFHGLFASIPSCQCCCFLAMFRDESEVAPPILRKQRQCQNVHGLIKKQKKRKPRKSFGISFHQRPTVEKTTTHSDTEPHFDFGR